MSGLRFKILDKRVLCVVELTLLGMIYPTRLMKVGSPSATSQIEIVDIDQPPDFITSGVSCKPEAAVLNRGPIAHNISVACSIWISDKLEYYDKKIISSLETGVYTQVVFKDWIPQGLCRQEYRIKASTDYSDSHPENNYKEKTCLIIEVLLAEWDFEPTNEGFTHQQYRAGDWVDCWGWGQPSCGDAHNDPGIPPTPPYCWGTEIDNWYPNMSSARLISPFVNLPKGSKRLRLKFKHWYDMQPCCYAGGNVKVSKDGKEFEIIEPFGGYPYTADSYTGLGKESCYSYSGIPWRDAIFDIDLIASPMNRAQFAWDFGSCLYNNWYKRWGWTIDNVKVSVRCPPVAITDIKNLPTIAGINCEYIPMVIVKNQWEEDLEYVKVIRRIGILDSIAEYESYRAIGKLAKNVEFRVHFDTWIAPSKPWVTLYDSIFAGVGGFYTDTLARIFDVGVDVAGLEAIEPLDSIFINTTYYPLATIEAPIGCDVPYACTLQLRDEMAKVLYLSIREGILDGPKEQVFDSMSVGEFGWYTFILVIRYKGEEKDANPRNDTLRWEVKAPYPPTIDVGVKTITMSERIQPGDSLIPKAAVENYGLIPVSFDVECTIEPGDYVDTKAVTDLEPGATQEIEFKVWVPESVGDYKVTVTALLDDWNPENNSKEETISVRGIAERPTPTKFGLFIIRSNPMSEGTVISYQLPVNSKVSLAIYDISGKLVKTLVSNYLSPGYYSVIWDGRNNSNKNVSAGIYFIKLLTPEYTTTRKLVLLIK